MSNMMISAYVWAKTLPGRVVEALKEESGQDLVEYAVLVGAIGVAAAVAFFALPLDTYLSNFIGAVGNCIDISQGSGYTCP